MTNGYLEVISLVERLHRHFLEVVKLELPPERPPGKVVGKGVEAVPELVRLLKEEAKVL